MRPLAITISLAVLATLTATLTSAGQPGQPVWTCNASGTELPGECAEDDEDLMTLLCPGGMSSKPGGGQACNPSPGVRKIGRALKSPSHLTLALGLARR